MRYPLKPVLALLCALALAAPAGLAAPAAVASGGPVVEPVEGAFQLDGRGFGHGRGMSQWGAQGAAVSGVGYQKILGTYYPGTDLVRGSTKRKITVVVTADDDRDMRVLPATGLQVKAGRDVQTLPTRLSGEEVSLWRVKKRGGNLRLSGRAGGEWRDVRVDGRKNLSSPVKLRPTSTSRGVRLVLPDRSVRDYRGQLWAYADSRTPDGQVRTVNRVPMEAYLRSVVPSEVFSTWEPAALRAQSVAARTYALWHGENASLGFADICDTTACQVYHGRHRLDADGNVTQVWEAASTDAAIKHTAGRRLDYQGEPAFTEFSASNGGYSTAGRVPYQVAKKDPWDGVVSNNASAWTAQVPRRKVAERWPQVGRPTGITAVERDGRGAWGGRVLRVKIIGTDGSETVSGAVFASAMGLRHSWWQGAAATEAAPAPAPSEG